MSKLTAKLSTLFLVLLVTTLGVAGCKANPPGGSQSGPGGKSPVAMLDPEAIYKLPEFVDANDKLNAKVKQMTDELDKRVKNGQIKQQDLEIEKLKMTQELEQFRATLLNPLNDRVRNVLAAVGKEQGYDVVLDKRIVVLGVPDITDAVKERFQKDKDVKAPDDTANTDKSTVGYVNQDVVSDLKMFHDAEAELQTYYKTLADEFSRKSKNLPAAEKSRLEQELAGQFQAKKEELYTPLQNRVNEIISQVAKEQGMSLVLDTKQVMWGGRNITDDVIKVLIKAKS